MRPDFVKLDPRRPEDVLAAAERGDACKTRDRMYGANLSSERLGPRGGKVSG